MEPVAVGGLHDQIIRAVHRLRVRQDRLILVAHVAAEHDLALLPVLGQPDLDGGGAQQMPHVGEADGHALVDLIALAILAAPQQLDRAHGALHGVEGRRRHLTGALRLAFTPLGVGLLNVGGVPQHQVAQATRRAGGEDRAPEAVVVQLGQQAGVVDVGMGQEHRLHRGGGHGQRFILEHVDALLHTAVHKEIAPAAGDHRAAAGHLMRRAQKGQFHSDSRPFSAFAVLASFSGSIIAPFLSNFNTLFLL